MSEPKYIIWEDVKSLLHQHDCVIVPGFGGFVCNREPARIDQVSHVITPPSRKVVFNQNLKTNDGLLAGHLAKKQGIGYSQAMQLIDETVQQTLILLQEKKQLAIDLFGNFRLNADANYVFLPDKRNNYLISSYGLGPIQAEPVASRSVRVIKSRIFKDRKEPQTNPSKRRVWPVVLVGVLAVLLTVNGYIFLNDHSTNDLHSGNNMMSISSWFDSLFSHKQTSAGEDIKPVTVIEDSTLIPLPPTVAEEVPATAEATDTMTVQDHTQSAGTAIDDYALLYAFAAHFEASRGTIHFPQPSLELAETSLPTIAETVSPVPSSALSTSGVASGYYVIGGVFCKERNAKRFLSRLNESGYADAELLVNEDIHCKRVSYHKFTSFSEAEQFCNEIQASSNPGAWVLAVK